MAEEQKQGRKEAAGVDKRSLWQMLRDLLDTRFFVYLYDLWAMRFPASKRYRELSYDHLICRFCGNTIELLGAWKCECGFSRPGNYFGRCPKCLSRCRHIDCPACGFTMDVR